MIKQQQSTSAEPSSSPWGQARPTGASEADGCKRGWWGQARPMGAVSRRAKSLVNITRFLNIANTYGAIN